MVRSPRPRVILARLSRRSTAAVLAAAVVATGAGAAALALDGDDPAKAASPTASSDTRAASAAEGPSSVTSTSAALSTSAAGKAAARTAAAERSASAADRAAAYRTKHRKKRTWTPRTTTTRPRTTTTTHTTTTAPTGTTTTTPTSASCAGTAVWSSLAACGWPGPGNTGYPSGTSLKASGALVITKAGTVVDGLNVTGGIQVRAKDVVIRNSMVSMSAGGKNGSGVININPGASATIERTTINGQNATHSCIWHEGVSMKAVANNCYGVNDGIFMWATTEGKDGAGDNFTIQDNWLHGFTTNAANGHVDGIQTEGAKHGVIRHNTIDVTQSQTSAISLWNSRKSTDDVVVDHNLIAGGGFSIYAEDYSPSEANPAGGYSVTNIRITNNVFSTVHFGCVGYWGVWFPRGAPTDGWNRSGNTVWETGAKIDSGNPTYKGNPCN